MYFMNVETTSIYETRGYPHLCAYFVISNIISHITNPPLRTFLEGKRVVLALSSRIKHNKAVLFMLMRCDLSSGFVKMGQG